MKSILLLIPFTALSLLDVQCNKAQNDIPECVWNRIKTIEVQPKWNPPAEVNQYLYNGKQVYLFTSDCCDQYIMLYDGSCNYICAPSGGITGSGDGKCADFYTNATHVKLVWKDSR